ncbi:unnamed protein product [Rangifer tarandus platyrhynchus]|uniref:Uncharacterized protein n=1 Tax=Rangifer tarandus platyrhynchus TaxID=3082113 RepID=A0AC59Y9C3_RANTA
MELFFCLSTRGPGHLLCAGPPPGWVAVLAFTCPKGGQDSRATFLRAAVSLGYKRCFFVWFSLSPEDKAQASFIFEFPAPGIELAHFSFSKCLLSRGMKSQMNE